MYHYSCIICQKNNKKHATKKASTAKKTGISSFKWAADARDDFIVKKKSKILEIKKKSFLYHYSNYCYRIYTHKVYTKLLDAENEDIELTKDVATLSKSNKSTSRSVPPINKPFAKNRRNANSQKQKCTLGGSDLSWDTSSKKYMYTKCRLCQLDIVQFFPDATKLFQDEICNRAAELASVNLITALYLFYHKKMFYQIFMEV